MTRIGLVLIGVWCWAVIAQAGAQLGPYDMVEFSPAHGQTFTIPVILDQPAGVEINLLTSDGDLVRVLKSDSILPAGTHPLVWDGKDEAGRVVPDEAYIPLIKVKTPDGESVLDPRPHSGGEVIEDLKVEITPERDIAYTLPASARVLVRVGIKGGPMLRSLATWQPHSPGKNIQRWDGRDASAVMDLRMEKDLTILVTAFRLPENVIITSGNNALSYRDYRTQNNWANPQLSPDQMALNRGDTRLSRHYYTPRALDADPRITLSLPADLIRNDAGLPVISLGKSIPVIAAITDSDRWLMNESLYEVAFFVDNRFVSEEEQGYLPLTWLWTPNDLSPGQHLLTVNVSGFSGKVGVASLLFIVQ